MADKSIGELKKATYFDDNSLIPAEQGGEAQALSGALLRKFAEDAGKAAGKAAVTDEVEQAAAHAAAAAQAQQGAKTSETNAKTSENAAAGSATKAAQSEKNAAQSAATAQQYSGKPPQPINGTWWIWDAATGSYKDSGVSSILRIVKSYTSIEAMEADYANMQDNDLVIIATDVELEENSKLYIHTPTGWMYLSDLSGIQGPRGEQGIQGPQGERGAKGDKGDTGPQGIQGIQGPKGDTGLKGDTGPQGEVGPAGPQGIQGPKGDTGIQGPRGEQGIQGPIGERGPEGPQGVAGVAVATSGFVAFNVNEDGMLECSYTGDEQPNYSITEDGYLILEI